MADELVLPGQPHMGSADGVVPIVVGEVPGERDVEQGPKIENKGRGNGVGWSFVQRGDFGHENSVSAPSHLERGHRWIPTVACVAADARRSVGRRGPTHPNVRLQPLAEHYRLSLIGRSGGSHNHPLLDVTMATRIYHLLESAVHFTSTPTGVGKD